MTVHVDHSADTEPHRVLYVGDVPVENTFAGSVQLFRLLCRHPADHLHTVVSDLSPGDASRALPDVRHDTLSLPLPWLIRSRYQPAYAAYLFLSAPSRAARVVRAVRGWQPQAVLTVAHAFGWRTAAAAADRLGVPLHLIVHDNPLASMGLPRRLGRPAEAAFGRVFRQAATRLCVSPAMAEVYSRRYGADAQVLYPVRDPHEPAFDAPPIRPAIAGPLTFAYAGSISSPAYAAALARLADVLGPAGHTLLLFSDWPCEVVRRHGLARPNVAIRPTVQPGRLVPELRTHADVLFAPLSFDPADIDNVEVAFPSKLTDYSATGLPLLVWGPARSSGVGWAEDHPGVAVVVTNPSTDALAAGVAALRSPERRNVMGAAALAAGQRTFGWPDAGRPFAPVLCPSEAQAR